MKYSLLFISFLLCWNISNAQEAAIALEVTSLDDSSFYFLAPSDWSNPQSGVYLREGEELYSSYLLVLMYPDKDIESTLNEVLPSMQQSHFPQVAGTLETPFAEWMLYPVTYFLPENPQAVFVVDIAATVHEGTAYLIILQTSPEAYQHLQAAVFQAAVTSFGQSRAALNATLEQGLLERIEISDFNLNSLVPREWTEVNAGAYMRLATPSDATTLLIQSSADLSPIEFANLFLQNLGLVLPADYMEYDSPDLAWSIYQHDLALLDSPMRLYLAIAQDRQQSYLVSLLVPLSEADRYYNDYLLPILAATMPIEEN